MKFNNLFLKLFNKKKYKQNKFLLKIKEEKQFFEEFIYKKIKDIAYNIKSKKVLNFLHSGHCGDLIYSLPIIKKLSLTHICNLYIGINKKLDQEYFDHPAKGVLIDDRMFNLILPLIKNQKYLNEVKNHNGENIDVNLDLFRELPISLHFNSSRWYSHITGANPDLSEPYIETPEHQSIKNKIIILRSLRYKNHLIDYKFLNNYDQDFLFIGLKNEYDELKQQVINLKWHETSDFFEMSKLIKSSKFFIGNQSLGFAIAEALKVPRLLENAPGFTVVQPTGGLCYDFYFQTHFEKYFDLLNNRNSNSANIE